MKFLILFFLFVINLNASSFDEKMCNNEYLFGCLKEGLNYRYGLNEYKKDMNKAIKYFKKACPDEDNPSKNQFKRACSELGEIYYFGYGNTLIDKTKGKIMLEATCDKDKKNKNSTGCHTLAIIYLIQSEVEKGLDLLKNSCDLGHSHSCYYDMNKKTLYDIAKLIINTQEGLSELGTILWSACYSDNGFGKACNELAYQTELGKLLKYDINYAKETYAKSCELGYKEGCRNYKRLSINESSSTVHINNGVYYSNIVTKTYGSYTYKTYRILTFHDKNIVKFTNVDKNTLFKNALKMHYNKPQYQGTYNLNNKNIIISVSGKFSSHQLMGEVKKDSIMLDGILHTFKPNQK